MGCRFVAAIVAEFVAQQPHPQFFAWFAVSLSSSATTCRTAGTVFRRPLNQDTVHPGGHVNIPYVATA